MSDAAARVTDLASCRRGHAAADEFLKRGRRHGLWRALIGQRCQSPILRRELSPKQAGNCGALAPAHRLGHPLTSSSPPLAHRQIDVATSPEAFPRIMTLTFPH